MKSVICVKREYVIIGGGYKEDKQYIEVFLYRSLNIYLSCYTERAEMVIDNLSLYAISEEGVFWV